MDLSVLFQRDSLVVVDKPAGMLVHNSAFAGPKEHTLTDLVRERFPLRAPLHRLDRGTSGCCCFSSSDDAARFSALLQEHEKHYLAIVRGHVGAVLEVDH